MDIKLNVLPEDERMKLLEQISGITVEKQIAYKEKQIKLNESKNKIKLDK